MLFGNFVSGQVKEHTKTSVILDMQITKDGETGKILIDSVDYVPIYCYDKGSGSTNRYELISIREAIQEYESGDTSKITASLYKILKSELENVESVLGDPITEEV